MRDEPTLASYFYAIHPGTCIYLESMIVRDVEHPNGHVMIRFGLEIGGPCRATKAFYRRRCVDVSIAVITPSSPRGGNGKPYHKPYGVASPEEPR